MTRKQFLLGHSALMLVWSGIPALVAHNRWIRGCKALHKILIGIARSEGLIGSLTLPAELNEWGSKIFKRLLAKFCLWYWRPIDDLAEQCASDYINAADRFRVNQE